MSNPTIHFRPAVMTLFLIYAVTDGRAQTTATEQMSSQITCREIAVFGAVRRAARFDVTSNVSVVKALAMVGGPNEHAGKTLHVLHPCNCSKCGEAASKVNEYELADVLRAKESGGPLLAPGDILVVDEVSVVFITGNVLQQKEVRFLEGLTLTKAIAYAGGISIPSDAVLIRIIRRRDIEPYLKPILVDLKAVRERRAADLSLEPWDIVEVSDSQGHFQSPGVPLHLPIWDTPIKPRKDNSAS